MRHSLRLAPKLTLVFVIFAIVLLTIVGTLAYRSGRASLEDATLSGLVSTAIEKEASLEKWLANAQNRIVIVAASPTIQERIAQWKNDSDVEDRELLHKKVVNELKLLTGAQDVFADLAILDPITGKIIIATNPALENTYNEDRTYFINGKKGPFIQNVYFKLGCQCPALTASAPIRSDAGELLAVIVGSLNLDDMGNIINRSSGQYKTIDAYLLNTSNLLVTQPRFATDSTILQRGVYTDATDHCLLGNSGTIEDHDYRDVPAMVAYRWMANRNLCLVVKVDQAEALAPVAAFGRTLLIADGFALFAALIIAVTLAQTITKPVLSLQNSVTRFGQGDVLARLPENSKDELGLLAHEFNKMADSIVEKEELLQIYAKNLEERVNERTAQLSFLATASSVLSESFDYADRLKKVAELAVPKIADWCSVDVLDENGILQRLAVVHTDPQKVAYAYELQRRFPPDPNATTGNYNVVRTGKSEFYPIITEEMVATSGASDEILDIIRQLGLRASMTVPLMAHGHSFGTITLVMAESGRHFETADLTLVEDLARRAGLLIDNAKLFKETQELNSELEQRVQERTSHLTAVNKELEAFSYSVSHDLRAPLRAVDGFSQALLEDYYDKFDDMGRDFLNRIRKESQRMGQLIDDLIGLSRFSRTEMNFTTVDLSRVVREIADDCQAKEPERAVELSIREGVKVCGDERLIRVALQNLISNAWKFTMKTPQAHIEFGCTNGDSPPEYYVRDNGAGFDMAYVNKLFGAFQRLHAMDEFTGTGIGLATVQRIMHRHGGSVRAEGKVNAGATFYFTLGDNSCTE